MAIIDRKLDEDAARQAREYAERHDTAAAHDWQQPPPAYEEAPGPSHRHPQEGPRDEREPARGESPQMHDHGDADDEATPLLTRRQRLFQQKKLSTRRKVKKGIAFICASLLLACTALLLLKAAGLLDRDDVSRTPILSRRTCIHGRLPPLPLLPFMSRLLATRIKDVPNPPNGDGKPVSDPIWSTPVATKPDLWPNPYVPLFSSQTNFTFSAFNEFYLRARGSGSSYSGQVTVDSSIEFKDEEWEQIHDGAPLDRVFVQVEARFTEVALRDSILVKKMKMSKTREGVGIYGAPNRHGLPKTSFISFHIRIFLPIGRWRSHAGQAEDKSSFIPEVDVSLDNMRISLEQMQDVPTGATQVTLGRLRTSQLNGGLIVVSGFKANESVSISLQNGQISDILQSTIYSIMAPKISINVVNGPIWISKLIARDEIVLKSATGGINVTDIAIAKSITLKHDFGVTGGRYRTEDLQVSSASGNVYIAVDLSRDIFNGEAPWSDEYTNGACRKRNVTIRSSIGEISVRLEKQDPAVVLSSSITSSMGTIEVLHDDGFEGTFDSRTQLGTIELHEPKQRTLPDGRTKQFVVATHDGGPMGIKRTSGRTWWSDHQWEEKGAFCKSNTFARSDAGRVSMYF